MTLARLVGCAALLVVAAAGCGSDSRGNHGTPNDLSLSPGSDAFQGCATGNYMAHQSPAALLVVLDASGTMAANNKYANAQQAIVTAIDQSAFDTMSLGLLGYPTIDVPAPACLLGLVSTVACGVSGLPQVPLAVAGTNLSSASSGVRHDIYQWLVNNSPAAGNGDGNPSYDAINNGITILQSYNISGKRILFYITDGGASCTSVSSRMGYTDGNGCPDWENPTSIVNIVKAAHDDPNNPVNTIIVGVPGADGQGNNQNEPPYHVRNALSAYAYAGSPETVPMGCTGTTYSQSGGDPSVSCHFDMTNNYSPTILTNAINQIRGALLGCVFDVPTPTDGSMVDPDKVNVEYTIGGMTYSPYKRSMMSNMCTNDGCWDYNASGQIVLIGKACSDVQTTGDVQVQIVVGCDTVIM